jgi:hypothetical protein
MPMVAPSGAALATASVPRLPLAPGLFSTRKTLCGYFVDSPSATMRAMMSGVEPAPNGTTMRTVLGGQSCAGAGTAAASSNKSAIVRRFVRLTCIDRHYPLLRRG